MGSMFHCQYAVGTIPVINNTGLEFLGCLMLKFIRCDTRFQQIYKQEVAISRIQSGGSFFISHDG